MTPGGPKRYVPRAGSVSMELEMRNGVVYPVMDDEDGDDDPDD